MTTLARAFTKTVNNRPFMSGIWSAVVLSTGDIILAVFVTALTLLVIGVMFGQEGAQLITSPYILINFMLTMQRVIHRVDDHWTVDEVGDKLSASLESIKERLDRIERNS